MRHRFSVRARFTAVASLLAVAIATAVAGGAWSEPGDSPAPPPPRDTSTVPAGSDVACADGWRGFSNPVLKYSLCYPQSWGFTDLFSAGPLPAIPRRALKSLRLLSAEGFPWVAGTSTFDAVARGVTEVELNVLQPGVAFEHECAPVANGGMATCSQAFNTNGMPSEAGSITAVKTIVPLALDGSQLLAIIRSSSASKGVEQAWKLVRSIRPL